MTKMTKILSMLVVAGAMAALYAPTAGAQTAKKLKCNGCVKSKQLQNNGIKGKDIKDGEVRNVDLGNNAVTGNKIADGAVSLEKLSPGVQSQLNASGSGDHSHTGLECTVEYDFIEEVGIPSIQDYYPEAAIRAELLQFGWICWNRDPNNLSSNEMLSPLTPYVADFTEVTHNQYWTNWSDMEQTCGRISWISNPEDVNPSVLVLPQASRYYGIRQMDGVTSTFHGYWADGGPESSGPSGDGDRWTVWTCR